MDEESEERINLADLFVSRPRRLTRLPRLLVSSLRLVRNAAPREFAVNAASQLVGAIGMAAQVLVARQILTQLVETSEPTTLRAMLPSIVALAAASTIVNAANAARIEQQRVLGELVARYAMQQVLDVATSVDLLAFESPAFHNRLQRAYTNAASRPLQMANGLLGILSALVTMAGISAALFVIEPLFLVFVGAAYIPVWIVTARASRITYRFAVEQTERDRQRAYLGQVLTRKEEAAEIRAFRSSGYLRARYDRLYDERLRELREMAARRIRLALTGGLLTSLLNAVTTGLIVWFVTSGRLQLAEAGAAVGAIMLLGQRLALLAGSTGSLFESSLFVEDFVSFVGAMPALEAKAAAGLPADEFRTIRARDVCFTYPSGDRSVLHEVSFEINAGEVIALVGENGSGKTTLAKLIAGLYAPTSGVIEWNGTDVVLLDPGCIQRSIGVIFQDFAKYLLSAHDNIALGDPEAGNNEQAVREAAERASINDVLEALPHGYDTKLGARFWGGSDLSGGQWQRVALARAFFRDAPLLILDEPTAALDPRSEATLFERIRDLARGRTVLVISHRFSTVRTADRIYVLEHGRITETGTHQQLMNARGQYAELFNLQAAAYLDAPDLEV